LWGTTCVGCIGVEHVLCGYAGEEEDARWVGMGSNNDEHLIARKRVQEYDKCRGRYLQDILAKSPCRAKI